MSGAALRTTVVHSSASGQWFQIWVRSEWCFHVGFRSGSGRDGKHLIGSNGWKLVFRHGSRMGDGCWLGWRWWSCVFAPVVVFVKVEVLRRCGSVPFFLSSCFISGSSICFDFVVGSCV
ncbi:hypothetical protein QL285_031792 [Trifolium repens]|nr:hypothetical protein QL285_031792 [Trifolium repens]